MRSSNTKKSDLKSAWVLNANDRLFQAWATVEMRDNQGQIIPIEKFEEIMPALIDRAIPIHLEHTNQAVGVIKNYEFAINPEYNKRGLLITGKIYSHFPKDNEAWIGVQNGDLGMVSIGGQSGQLPDGNTMWVAMCEVALTKKGANNGATIEAVSMAKSDTEFDKEKKEHPELPDSTIKQIVADHEAKKSEMKKGDLEDVAAGIVNKYKGESGKRSQMIVELARATVGMNEKIQEGSIENAIDDALTLYRYSMKKEGGKMENYSQLAKKCMEKSLDAEDVKSIEGIARGFLEGETKSTALKNFKESGFGDDNEAIAIFNRVAKEMGKSEGGNVENTQKADAPVPPAPTKEHEAAETPAKEAVEEKKAEAPTPGTAAPEAPPVPPAPEAPAAAQTPEAPAKPEAPDLQKTLATITETLAKNSEAISRIMEKLSMADDVKETKPAEEAPKKEEEPKKEEAPKEEKEAPKDASKEEAKAEEKPPEKTEEEKKKDMGKAAVSDMKKSIETTTATPRPPVKEIAFDPTKAGKKDSIPTVKEIMEGAKLDTLDFVKHGFGAL